MLHSPKLDEDEVPHYADHEDRRGDLIPGEWRRDCNLEDTRNVNCEKYAEALGQLFSGKCAMARQDGPKLEVEIECNFVKINLKK